MGLILAGIALLMAILWVVLVIMANANSAAPSVTGISPWPVVLLSLVVAAFFVAVHYFGL